MQKRQKCGFCKNVFKKVRCYVLLRIGERLALRLLISNYLLTLLVKRERGGKEGEKEGGRE